MHCRSSSFLARLRGNGGVGKEGDEEYTGLRSLMHSMSKEDKRASTRLVDDGKQEEK